MTRPSAKQFDWIRTAKAVPYAAAIALNVAANDEFVLGLITGDVEISFTNAAVGRYGVIWAKGDGTGGWRIGFTAPAGFTILEDSTLAAEADIAANAMARITYVMHVLDGVNYVELDRSVRVVAPKVVTYNGATVKRTGDRLVTS